MRATGSQPRREEVSLGRREVPPDLDHDRPVPLEGDRTGAPAPSPSIDERGYAAAAARPESQHPRGRERLAPDVEEIAERQRSALSTSIKPVGSTVRAAYEHLPPRHMRHPAAMAGRYQCPRVSRRRSPALNISRWTPKRSAGDTVQRRSQSGAPEENRAARGPTGFGRYRAPDPIRGTRIPFGKLF